MWQPIKTAPTDGSWVWGFTLGAPVYRAYAVWFFDEWANYWVNVLDDDIPITPPTHWMPLPEPPEDSA